MKSPSSWILIATAAVGAVWVGSGAPLTRAQGMGSSPATPAELVATYDGLADAILAVKETEVNLVRSILGGTYAHARVEADRARSALRAGDTGAARASLENLAAVVGQLATEGDNAVAGIRKRLLEGGHHHNAQGEAQGIFDPGFVIVTRAAKKEFLEASRAIGLVAGDPQADALDAAWSQVESAWRKLMGMKS